MSDNATIGAAKNIFDYYSRDSLGPSTDVQWYARNWFLWGIELVLWIAFWFVGDNKIFQDERSW
jgi:hypothetical protein